MYFFGPSLRLILELMYNCLLFCCLPKYNLIEQIKFRFLQDYWGFNKYIIMALKHLLVPFSKKRVIKNRMYRKPNKDFIRWQRVC